MEFPLLEDNKNWEQLQATLGYSFLDGSLLAEAMTHSSFANEFQPEGLPDNERLEFLGDAVLDLVISQYLMEIYPDFPEGELTRVRADVVAMPSLAGLARQLNLGACLLLGKGEERSGGRNKSNLLADALEALIGAVFTDNGYDSVRDVILPFFIPLIKSASSKGGEDYKSRLQEQLQASGEELPVYRLVDTEGPPHERTYHVDVLVRNRIQGAGQGRTKKAAEQAAAEAALVSLDNTQ